MNFLPVVNRIYMEGILSQIFYIGLGFYFVIKNGKLVVIIFLQFIQNSKMQTMILIKILRHNSLHIDGEMKQ